MAFIIPFLPYILAATAVAGGAMAAKSQHDAGVATDEQNKFQARIEGDAAKGREIGRRQDLMRALASQNAAAGTAGVETSGSIGGIARTNIKQNQQDLLYDAAGVSARRSALLAAGSNARVAGNTAAIGSLFSTASSAAGAFGGAGGPGGGGLGYSRPASVNTAINATI